MRNTFYKNGYVAIISVLILSTVLVSIGILLSTTSILEGQISRSNQDSNYSLNLTESCAEEALSRLNQYGALPESLIILGEQCDVTLISEEDDIWTFEIVGNVNNYYKKIGIIAERSDRVYILSWEEL